MPALTLASQRSMQPIPSYLPSLLAVWRFCWAAAAPANQLSSTDCGVGRAGYWTHLGEWPSHRCDERVGVDGGARRRRHGLSGGRTLRLREIACVPGSLRQGLPFLIRRLHERGEGKEEDRGRCRCSPMMHLLCNGSHGVLTRPRRPAPSARGRGEAVESRYE